MSTTTIESVILPNCKFTGSGIKLRIFLQESFVTSDGIPLQWGNTKNNRWYKEVDCTLVGTNLTIASFTIDSTVDGLDKTTSHYVAHFFKGNTDLGLYAGFEQGFRVPNTPSSWTWAELRSFNFTVAYTYDGSVYTKTQVNQLIDLAEGAPVSSPFLTTTASAALTGATNLGLLSTGLLKITVSAGVATPSAAVAGTDYLAPNGSGASLTGLNASALATGTIPDGRFPSTLPALSGANLTALNASNLASGTIPDARFPATLPALSGVNLTALNASNLGSGTIPDARFPSTLPALSGVNLTALNASNLASGTILAARMPALTGDVTSSVGGVATTLAATIAGVHTFTGNITGPFFDRGGLIYNAKSYLVDDGTTDNAAALQDLISNTIPSTGAIIDFSTMTNAICLASSITIGNGTGNGISSRHGVVIRGRSGHKMNTTGIGTNTVTCFKWTGANGGGPLFDVNGPVSGIRFESFYVDGNSTLADAFDVIGAEGVHFFDIKVEGHKGWAAKIDHYVSGTIVASMFDKSDTPFISHFTVNSTIAGSKGIKIGGTSSVSQLYMDNSRITLQGGGNTAIQLGSTDSCQFSEVVTSVDGTSSGIKVMPISGVSQSQYPENQFFYGCAIIGGVYIYNATVTITLASPGVVTSTDHRLDNDTPIVFSTTGTLPTGLVVGTTYYVRNATANTFEVSATAGGASIDTSVGQSGVHTAALKWTPANNSGLYFNPYATADSQTVPDDARVWGVTDKRIHFPTMGVGRHTTTPTNTLHLRDTAVSAFSPSLRMSTSVASSDPELQFLHEDDGEGFSISLSGGASPILRYVYTGDSFAGRTQVFSVSPTGVYTVGSASTVWNDSTGKILSAALNTVGVAQGGTGLATLTTFALLTGGTTGTGALQQVGVGTSGQVLTSNGAGVLPSFQANPAGFADPMTTRGDFIFRNTSNVTDRLAVGAANSILTSNGTDPSYSATPTIGTSLTTPQIYGGTANNSKASITGTSHVAPSSGDILLNSTYTAAIDGSVRIGTTAGGPYRLVVADNATAGLRLINTGTPSSAMGAGIIAGHSTLPTATGHRLGFLAFGATDGIDGALSNAAVVAAFTTEDWSAGAGRGAVIRFETTPTGSGTGSRAERWRIEQGGWLVGKELTTDPTTTELAAGDQAAIYVKNDKLAIAYNLAGVINYLVIQLDGSDTTWANSTTAP